MGSNHHWLVAANFILCTLLGLSVLRYRGLERIARDEQARNNDLIDNLSEGIYRSTRAIRSSPR